MGRLTAIVLGSAAGGAFPQWNCRCPVCALAWAGDARVRPRTQADIVISAGDGHWSPISASPDLGAPIRAIAVLHPRDGLRDGVMAEVLAPITDAQIADLAYYIARFK